MAAKYQLITELYRRTGVAVAKNPQAWQGFLSSACRNYKCRFDEQLLIYAQRPDAVAVAKLETWNSQFKRCGKAKHKVDLGADALGNLTRIENELSRLPVRLEAAKTKKAETIAQLETAKEEIKKPFAFEDELKEKTERLNALNIELNLNEKDTSVMDTEPEQAEEQPERKCASRER